MACGTPHIPQGLGMCVDVYLQNVFSLFKSQHFCAFLAKLPREKKSQNVDWPKVILLSKYAETFFIKGVQVFKLSKSIYLKCQDKKKFRNWKPRRQLGWFSSIWLRLKSWSQGPGTEQCMGGRWQVWTQQGVSLSLSLCPSPPTCMHTLSASNKQNP